MTFQDVVKLHPQPIGLDRDALLRCIEECRECAATCTACADASLAEGDLAHLVRVIRCCLDCADACEATSRVVTRQTAPDLHECERHAGHHEHCRVCAEACRRCKKACDDLLDAIGTFGH
jgi:hypothetical protein